jgi:uncharacterized Fe-S radical SAM superfamily protein PflX
MIIKGLLDEDFVQYKKPSMTIIFPKCTFKCDDECGERVCQNSTLATSTNIEIHTKEIIKRYLENNLTSSIVCAGLEPFDTYEQLRKLIKEFRKVTNDDIVIYTGYYRNEIKDMVKSLSSYVNITIKFGRFIPGQEKHHDEILGVDLASNNQYAERIS